jgi:hypothetical protein
MMTDRGKEKTENDKHRSKSISSTINPTGSLGYLTWLKEVLNQREAPVE